MINLVYTNLDLALPTPWSSWGCSWVWHWRCSVSWHNTEQRIPQQRFGASWTITYIINAALHIQRHLFFQRYNTSLTLHYFINAASHQQQHITPLTMYSTMNVASLDQRSWCLAKLLRAMRSCIREFSPTANSKVFFYDIRVINKLKLMRWTFILKDLINCTDEAELLRVLTVTLQTNTSLTSS